MKHRNNPNIFGEFNLRITLNIIFISLVASALTTTVYALVDEEDKNTVTFAVTVLATTAGGLGAFYAYKSLRQGRQDKVIDKTHSFIERWNDPQLISLKITAKQVLDLSKKQPHEEQDSWLVKHCIDNPEQALQIIHVLNFLTEIALCIEEGIVDESLLKKYFKIIVFDYCEDFHALINYRKGSKHNQERYRALIALEKKWNGKEN